MVEYYESESMRCSRELQTRQDEALKSASESSTKRGENGIMHSMKNLATPTLALALAIVGVVAAPLRSDACSGSCGCGVGNAAFVICKMKRWTRGGY